MMRILARTVLGLAVCAVLCAGRSTHAGLLGYWSGDSTGGAGTAIPNDQGDASLNGELFGGASYSADGEGHTGQAGDYAMSFAGTDTDYGSLPATGATLTSATVTAWVKGHQTGDWAGLVFSRDSAQPIGIDIPGSTGNLAYTWNNNSPATYNFASDLAIPVDEWAFVAMTVTPTEATLYVGPESGDLMSATNAIAHDPQTNATEWRLAEDNCCGTARNFGGLIDDVAIWDRALSVAELSALHTGAATPLTVPEPSALVLLGTAVAGLFGLRLRRVLA